MRIGFNLRFFFPFQKKVLEKPAPPSTPKTAPSPVPAQKFIPPDTGPYSDAENEKLKGLVIQRDNEISILYLVFLGLDRQNFSA